MKYITEREFPIGKLRLAEDGGGLCSLCLMPSAPDSMADADDCELRETPLLSRTLMQLDEYFAGRRRIFDVPLSLRGTVFQQRVWEVLQRIPYGKTFSYGQIAYLTGNAKSSRAVGMANHRNPVMIIVPCHRVIGADGSLTGYAGGLDIKRQLLDLEAGFLSLNWNER